MYGVRECIEKDVELSASHFLFMGVMEGTIVHSMDQQTDNNTTI